MTPHQLSIERENAGLWRVSFNNPPINMFVPTTIVELGALMTDLEADPSVKVVVFQSANPDFFIAHLDVSKAAERPEMLGLWRDFVLRPSSTPVVSIAKIRGRTRGIGNEFVLACDNDLFFPLPALPGAQARRATIRNIGYGAPSDFDLNFGRYLPALGRADDDTDSSSQGG